MSAKMWEATVEHPRTCILDKRIFLYCLPSSQRKSGVAFNVGRQVMGLVLGYQYIRIDKLSETQKADAQSLVINAYEHWEEVVSFDDEASLMGSLSHSTNVLHTSSTPRMENSNGSSFLASDNMVRNVSFANIIPSINPVGNISGLDNDNALHGIENMGRMENSNGSRFLASDNTAGFDFTQPNVSSANVIPSIYPVGNVSGLDDDNAFHSTENMSPTYNPTIFDATNMTEDLSVDDYLDLGNFVFQP